MPVEIIVPPDSRVRKNVSRSTSFARIVDNKSSLDTLVLAFKPGIDPK